MIHNVHFLRGVAAFMVVVFHIFDILFRHGVIPVYPGFGKYGVDIFFVISGFIIFVAMKPGLTAASFFKRRILRVVPVYWVATLFVFLTIYVLGNVAESPDAATIPELLKSLFFIPYLKADGSVTPILFVGWTLQYEMMFYLIATISIAFFDRRFASLFAVVLITVFFVAGVWAEETNLIFWFFTRPIILEFAAGIACGWIWLSRERWAHYASVWQSVLLLILGCAAFGLARDSNPFWPGLGASLIVLAGLVAEAADFKAIDPVAAFLGDISYSLYLMHPIGLFGLEIILVKLGLIDSASVLVLSIGVVLAMIFLASWLSYKYIELPSQHLARHHWVNRPA